MKTDKSHKGQHGHPHHERHEAAPKKEDHLPKQKDAHKKRNQPNMGSNNRLMEEEKGGNEALRHVMQEKDPIKRSMIVENYKIANTYRFPAHLGVALCHKQANRIGRRDIEAYLQAAERGQRHPDPQQVKNKQNYRLCPCCENTMIVEEFPLCTPTNLYKVEKDGYKNQLPISIIMYMAFLKMVVVYMILRFLIFDVVNIIYSLNGGYCDELTSPETCVIKYSGYNMKSSKDQGRLFLLDLLSFIFIGFGILLFIRFRKIINKQKNLFVPFPFFRDSNYTILLQKIPPFFFTEHTRKYQTDYHYQNMLQKIIEDKVGQYLQFLHDNQMDDHRLTKEDRYCLEQVVKGNRMSLQELKERSIAAVSICYDIPELANISKMREDLLEEFTDREEGNAGDKNLLSYIPNQVKHLNQEYVKLANHFEENQQMITEIKLTHFTGRAFVSFEYEHYKNYFLRRYQENENFLKISGKSIKIDYSNEPEDVSWENMIISDVERNKKVVYSWVVVAMLLILSFAAFFGLQVWSQTSDNNSNSNSGGSGPNMSLNTNNIYSYIVSALQAALQVAINEILIFAMQKLSNFERHKIKSDRLKSLTIKVIIAQTLNVVFIYGIFYLIYLNNPLGSSGLVNKLLNFLFLHCFFRLVVSLCHPKYILNWYISRRYTKKDLREPINKFQITLNDSLELPEFNFPKYYAFYIISVYVVAFYGFINPFLTLIPIGLFSFQYWADKHNLLRRFSCPEGFDLQYTEMMVSALEFSLFMFALGYLIWDTGVHFGANGGFIFMNVLALLLSGTYVAIFMFSSETTKNKILRNYKKPDFLSYSDYMSFKINKFAKTFYTENPATAMFRDMEIVANYISDSQQERQKQKARDKYATERDKKPSVLKRYKPKFKQYLKQKINLDTFEANDKGQDSNNGLSKGGTISNREKLKRQWRQKQQYILRQKINKDKDQNRGYVNSYTLDPSKPINSGNNDHEPKFTKEDLLYHKTRKLSKDKNNRVAPKNPED